MDWIMAHPWMTFILIYSAIGMLKTAFSCIQKKDDRPSKAPLTFNGLRRMTGKPVWLVPLEDKPDWTPCWSIAELDHMCVPSESNGSRVYLVLEYKNYGKTWIAYQKEVKT